MPHPVHRPQRRPPSPWRRWFDAAPPARRCSADARLDAALREVLDAHDDAPPANPDDDVPRGCAWYVSSHDLAHGVEVQERDATDADLWPLLSWQLRYA